MGISLSSLGVAYGAPFQAPASAGAARYRSYVWPDPSQLFVTTAIPNTVGVRGRISSVGLGVQTSNFAGGATNFPGLVNGLAGALITNNPGSLLIRIQGQICNIKTQRGQHIQPATADDSTCSRVWANLACSTGAPITNDQGLYMVQPGGITPRVILDGGAGFGFLVGQAGVVSFVVRGPNGLILTPLTAAPFDVTAHHTYELLIAGVTPFSDGSLTALIDGIAAPLPALSRSWGPGTNLPPNVTNAAESGFVPAITSSNGVLNSTVHVQQLGIAWGPTLGSLL
jgi:hypothetical protein